MILQILKNQIRFSRGRVGEKKGGGQVIERLETIRETEKKAGEIVNKARAEAAANIDEAEQEKKELTKKAKEAAEKKGAEICQKLREEAEKEAEGLREEASVERGHISKAAESNLENAINIVMERLIS